MFKVMGESFQSMGNLSKKKMRDERNIVGDWRVDKNRGGEQKICGGVLSWGVLLRGVVT